MRKAAHPLDPEVQAEKFHDSRATSVLRLWDPAQSRALRSVSTCLCKFSVTSAPTKFVERVLSLACAFSLCMQHACCTMLYLATNNGRVLHEKMVDGTSAVVMEVLE